MSAKLSGSRYVSVLLICSAVATAEECPDTIIPKLEEFVPPVVAGPVPIEGRLLDIYTLKP